jgi:hypothetical protein
MRTQIFFLFPHHLQLRCCHQSRVIKILDARSNINKDIYIYIYKFILLQHGELYNAMKTLHKNKRGNERKNGLECVHMSESYQNSCLVSYLSEKISVFIIICETLLKMIQFTTTNGKMGGTM